MEEFHCRTCLTITYINKATQITKKCYRQKTIKDVIVYMVPEMEETLVDEEFVCGKCLETIKNVMNFIERCLDVECILAQNRDHLVEEDENYGEIEDEQQDLSKSPNRTEGDHNYITIKENNIKHESEDGEVEGEQFVKQELHFYEETSNLSAAESQEAEEALTDTGKPIQIVFDDSMYIEEGDDQDEEVSQEEGIDQEEGDESTAAELDNNEIYLEQSQVEDLINDDETETYYTCSTCSEMFCSEDEYKAHQELHLKFVCPLCDKKWENSAAYDRHMAWHKLRKPPVCGYCKKLFISKKALNVHLSVAHQVYMCRLCYKVFKQKFKLDYHVKMVHLKMGRTECSECGKLFQNKEAMDSHHRLVHQKIKPFICHVCAREFGRKDYLLKHIAQHSQVYEGGNEDDEKKVRTRSRSKNPTGPVVCRVCGKKISTIHLLKAHLRTHVRLKRYGCKYCELTFTLPTNRDRHEKSHEADPENKYRCNICWKRVKTEEDLERHVAGHSNRPAQHACEVCGERFHRRYLLDNHNLDKHTGPEDIARAEEEIERNLLEYALDP